MKYAIIVFISLLLVLSLEIGVKYNWNEMFPKYYGCPFVFKQTSLGAYNEYFYSVFGILPNVLVLSIIVFFVRCIYLKVLEKVNRIKLLKIFNKISVGVFVNFSTINIIYTCWTMDSGLNRGHNYWYFDNQAKDWGMTCKGSFQINPLNF